MARPDYYDVTDCETSDKGAPKFCRKSEPGEGAERSCAYDGARVVLMPVTDVIHLVHGPIACAGNSWDNRGARSSGSQLYRRGFTTEMLENDVIFGGEKKLYKAILNLAVNNPIWPTLNGPAPWEKSAEELSADVAKALGHGAAFLALPMPSAESLLPKEFPPLQGEGQGGDGDAVGKTHPHPDPLPEGEGTLGIRRKAKAATVNPQKNSPALGATLAYLGIDGMLGLLHGAQGCSTFIRLQLSRHFKESIALNSTAMSEDTAIFGGWENLKQGLKRVIEKFGPAVVGVMTSGLTETMGDDVRSAIVHFRRENPGYDAVPIIHAATPDYSGSLQEGYAAAVEAIVATLPDLPPHPASGHPLPRGEGELNPFSPWEKDRMRAWTIPTQVNLLPGAHLTPADVEELQEIIESFGLTVLSIPDIANALDGHIDDEVSPLSTGGIPVEEIRRAGRSAATLFVGDSLARAAGILTERFGIPSYGFTSVTGIAETDLFLESLSVISGRPIPEKLRRWRSRLMDAMVDSHYLFGKKRVALALEGDHLKGMTRFLAGMGCEIQAALSATRVRGLDSVPAATVAVGDLEDLEVAAGGVDLIVANSNGRQAAGKLGIKAHLRTGLPVFDRLGAHQKVWVGYRGTLNLIFETANLFQATATEAQKLAHN